MEELTNEELSKKYPFLIPIMEYTLFTTREDFNYLKNGEKIIVNSEEVSIEFLKRILNNEYYFDYTSRYFMNEINKFTVSYIINGDTGASIKYKKSTIIKGIDKLIETGNIVLNHDEEKRYETLKNYISFNRFLKENKNDIYNIEIDNNKYSIPVIQLISIMQISDKNFDNLCSSTNIKTINGIQKDHFIYAAYMFFKEKNAIEEYDMSNNIVNNYMSVKSMQKIDLEALNKHLETTDTKYQNVNIDSNLKNAIIKDMPHNLTELEKAIYIYIKMCKLLTYDEEYYAVNQRGIATEKHKNIDYVSSINLNNNKVVCFEFNLIYSKLLSELGIHFSSDYKGMVGEAYGLGHASLEFRSQKYLVSADSVTTIFRGDIMQAKLNQPLVGLKCINKNIETQKEFKDKVTKIYQLIANQEKSKVGNQVEHIESLDELLREYSKVTSNIGDISLDERLSIIVDKVNSTEMVGIDSLSYVLQLRKILFTEEQRENNIGITIIRDNEPLEKDKVAMIKGIITINNYSFENNPNFNRYYYFIPNHKLMPISKEELQEKFNNGIFEYIEKDNPRIPGIMEKGGIKR